MRPNSGGNAEDRTSRAQFLDDEPSHGLRSHCRRVAALAVEVAGRLRLTPQEQTLVEQAALLHHYPVELLEGESFERLMRDLLGPGWSKRFLAETGAGFPDLAIREILEAIQAPPEGPAESRVELLAEVVEVSNLFCEQIEFLPYEHKTVEQILDDLRWMAQDGFFQASTVTALGSLPRATREELQEVIYRLPVFPTIALKTLALASSDEVSLQQLENLARSDQVLAGNLIRVSNSSYFSPIQKIASLRQAISYIGLESARKVLLGAVIQPLFGSAKLHELWKHSLASAQFCEQLARLSGSAETSGAFLAGLVHDIGRLVIRKLGGEAGSLYARMRERGCEPLFAELVLCRFEHSSAGAEVLRLWNFPEDVIEAVEQHHQPERSSSKLASLLYLVEYWTDSEEDLPSRIRLDQAMRCTGVTMEVLDSLERSTQLLDPLIHG